MGSEYSITYFRLRGKGIAHTIERLTLKAEPKKKISFSLSGIKQQRALISSGLRSGPFWSCQVTQNLRSWSKTPRSHHFHVCTHVAVEHEKTFTKEGGKTQKGPWTWPGLPPDRNILGKKWLPGAGCWQLECFLSQLTAQEGANESKVFWNEVSTIHEKDLSRHCCGAWRFKYKRVREICVSLSITGMLATGVRMF